MRTIEQSQIALFPQENNAAVAGVSVHTEYHPVKRVLPMSMM